MGVYSRAFLVSFGRWFLRMLLWTTLMIPTSAVETPYTHLIISATNILRDGDGCQDVLSTLDLFFSLIEDQGVDPAQIRIAIPPLQEVRPVCVDDALVALLDQLVTEHNNSILEISEAMNELLAGHRQAGGMVQGFWCLEREDRCFFSIASHGTRQGGVLYEEVDHLQSRRRTEISWEGLATALYERSLNGPTVAIVFTCHSGSIGQTEIFRQSNVQASGHPSAQGRCVCRRSDDVRNRANANLHSEFADARLSDDERSPVRGLRVYTASPPCEIARATRNYNGVMQLFSSYIRSAGILPEFERRTLAEVGSGRAYHNAVCRYDVIPAHRMSLSRPLYVEDRQRGYTSEELYYY